MFCSTGSDWHKDELEDFVHYYFTNTYRDDDWLANFADKYMAENGWGFARSLTGFCYLRRGHDEDSASYFAF